jgi:hypothetical protein
VAVVEANQTTNKGTRLMQKKFDERNRGVLFKSDRKDRPEDRDYHGEFTNAGGQEFWISGLAKTSKKGAKYLSLSFKLKNEPPAKAPAFNDSVEF